MTDRAIDAYIICGTPRSGSTMLCDLLLDSGAGVPASYFRRQSIPGIAQKLGVEPKPDDPDFEPAYLAAVLAAGRGGGRQFALRLMQENAPELLAMLDRLHPGLPGDPARLAAAFGTIRYVHLSRADKVAQAVSLLKAARTGLWHKHADGGDRERYAPAGDTAYEPEMLAETVGRLEADDAAWRSWFAAQGIAPFSITYEQFAVDPAAVMAPLLAFLGLDPAIAARLRPRTAKLADAQSADWISRFRSARDADG